MATSFTNIFSRACRVSVRSKITPNALSSRLWSTSRTTFPLRPALPARKAPISFVLATVGLGLGLSASTPRIRCDAATPEEIPPPPDFPPPPASSVSLYQLSFGTVSGICAGVFIKKGAKAAAWFLGGIFVLLQYLSSASVIRVDWGRVATRFENAFHTKDVNGVSRPPTVFALWRWLLDFLTADFQPRASFVAGLVLGLRIG